jgi:hypothetical protein
MSMFKRQKQGGAPAISSAKILKSSRELRETLSAYTIR